MWPCRKNEGVVLDYGHCGSLRVCSSEGSKLIPVTPRLKDQGCRLSFIGRPESIWRTKQSGIYGKRSCQPLITDRPHVRSILTSLIPDSHVPAELAADLSRDQSHLLENKPDPLMGRPLAWGRAAMVSRQTRQVDCLLYPAGLTSSSLKVDRLLPETVSLYCGDIQATVPSSQSYVMRQQNSIAFDFKTPIAQILPAASRWASSDEQDSSRTAVRTLGGSTYIFRLQYGENGPFIDQLVQVDPAADFSSTLLSTPRHSDVSFNPWYSRQVAIVDDRAVMSLWDLTGGANSTLTESSVADDHGSGNSFTMPLACWGADMNTILHSNGKTLSLIDVRSPNEYRNMDILGRCQASSGLAPDDRRIFDISRSPYNDHDCFTLVGNELVWIDLRMAGGPEPLLRWRHHLSPNEPLSMILSTCQLPTVPQLGVVQDQLHAAIYSSSSKGIKFFQFATQTMEDLPPLSVSLDDPYSISYSKLVPADTQALLLSEPASVKIDTNNDDQDLSSSIYCMYGLSTSQELSQQFLVSNSSQASNDWTFDSRTLKRSRKIKTPFHIEKNGDDETASEDDDTFLNVESRDRFKLNEMQTVDVQRLYEEIFAFPHLSDYDRSFQERFDNMAIHTNKPENSTLDDSLISVRADLVVDELERWLGKSSIRENISMHHQQQQHPLLALKMSLYQELCKWWLSREDEEDTRHLLADEKLADFIVSDVLASCAPVEEDGDERQQGEEKEVEDVEPSETGIDILTDDWKIQPDQGVVAYEWHEIGRQTTDSELGIGDEQDDSAPSSQRIMMAMSQQQDYTRHSVRIRQSGLVGGSSQMTDEEVSSSQPMPRQLTMSQVEPGPYGGRLNSTGRKAKRRKTPRAGF